MIRPLRYAMLAMLAFSHPIALLPGPALANYSCEPGQPNCTPMGGNGGGGGSTTPWPQISCRVDGQPRSLPDDLRFRNIGDVVIAGGTIVQWQIKQTGERGSFTLPRDLLVGAEIDDVDVLRTGLPPRTPCLVRLLQ